MEMESFHDESLYKTLLLTLYLMTPLTLLPLQFIAAPYGKHARPGWGPTIPAPLAWFLMESPTLWLTALLFPLGRYRYHPISLSVLSLYLLHYTNRTLIYPLRLFLSSKKLIKQLAPVPFLVAFLAFSFNLLNAYLQSRSATQYARYPATWPWPWWVWVRLVTGISIFFWGMKVNISSDGELMRLKEEAKGGYKIPRGGWFEVVSCPNYMGEAAEWLGLAVVAWSPAAVGFFLYTCANLGPRARANRRWYIQKFGDEYPASRKAFLPYLY